MYGVIAPRHLPRQDPELILILADRWARAAAAQEKWARTARTCVDMVEGRQWDEKTLREMAAAKRPTLTLNKIGRLLRLVMGYFDNNKNTINYLPGHDGVGTSETAEVLNRVSKQIDEISDAEFIRAEMELDGLVTGRGFIDSRLDFSDNDLGEVKDRAKDPFTVYPDPLAEDYDLNACSYLVERRLVSIDEIEWCYGREAGEALSALARSGGLGEGVSTLIDLYANADGMAPQRGFGGYEDHERWMNELHGLYGEMMDPWRRDVVVLDFQYWTRRMARVFVDLETGDRKTIPDDWGDDQIAKVLDYGARMGNPLRVVTRPVKKLRWSTLAGPLLVYDSDTLPYDTFSFTGYFPYFRRGQTRGMVEDMLDPQREVNKRRSATIEILSKTANGGWMVHENGMDEDNWRKLNTYGSTPGVVLKWKGKESWHKPEQIRPEISIQRMERLEEKADADFGEISGINESALGDLDKVQSGRAIEARQRQAVIAVQMYISNRNRTVQLLGKKRLNLIQRHYTEQRVIRIIGEDGNPVETVINQRVPRLTGGVMRLNDVTIGKYTVAIDDTPASVTFLNAQFEEALLILEKMGPVGAMLLELRPDLLVDMSSLPRKDEWTEAIQMALQAVQAGGVTAGADPAAMAGQPPGAPVAPGTPVPNAPSIDEGVGPGSNIVRIAPGQGGG